MSYHATKAAEAEGALAGAGIPDLQAGPVVRVASRLDDQHARAIFKLCACGPRHECMLTCNNLMHGTQRQTSGSAYTVAQALAM